MNTTTTSRIETTRRKGHTFRTRITVSRTPATLSESRMLRSRWFDYCADFVTETNRVEVTLSSIYTREDGTEYEDSNPCPATYLEIVTPAGRACVTRFKDGEEIGALVMNNGKALAQGMWTKYGQRRGYCCAYLRAHGINPNSRTKVSERCLAAIYATIRGEGAKWSVEAA